MYILMNFKTFGTKINLEFNSIFHKYSIHEGTEPLVPWKYVAKAGDLTKQIAGTFKTSVSSTQSLASHLSSTLEESFGN